MLKMSDLINPERIYHLKQHVQQSVINTSAPGRKERKKKHPEMETEKKKLVLTKVFSLDHHLYHTNPAEARIQLQTDFR